MQIFVKSVFQVLPFLHYALWGDDFWEEIRDHSTVTSDAIKCSWFLIDQMAGFEKIEAQDRKRSFCSTTLIIFFIVQNLIFHIFNTTILRSYFRWYFEKAQNEKFHSTSASTSSSYFSFLSFECYE